MLLYSPEHALEVLVADYDLVIAHAAVRGRDRLRWIGAAATAIDLAGAVKDHYDEGWIEGGARAALRQALAFGVRHVLAFAS